MSFPKVVVLDLDGTIWSPEMYELWGGGGAPFTRVRHDVVADRSGTKVRLFEGVWQCVGDSKTQGALLAVASSTDEPDWARECLSKLGPTPVNGGSLPSTAMLASHLDIVEIYKGSKRKHLTQIKQTAGVEFHEMLFIDNEYGNIQTVSELGVPSYHCPQGLTLRAWQEALQLFRRRL